MISLLPSLIDPQKFNQNELLLHLDKEVLCNHSLDGTYYDLQSIDVNESMAKNRSKVLCFLGTKG
jgi:hypothetical protein